MKKFFIGICALIMCFALVGCGQSNTTTISNLGNQLDETANIISSVEVVNPSDLNLSKEMLETIATKENSNAIYDNMIATQQTLLNEEYFKTDILSTTARIKNKLSKDLKLSKAQTTALKELSNNLSKYTNSVAYTKNDMESTVKNISSLKRNIGKNADKINAKLNRLACNSNSRSSFYENILSTLNQIESYLNIQEEQTAPQPEEQTSLPEQTDAVTDQKAAQEQIPNTPYTNFNSNNINRMAYPYGYGMNGYMMPYNAGFYGYNGMNGFGGMYGGYNYGMPYAYGGGNMNFGRYNLMRNTDTYAPFVRNIDTYKSNTANNSVAVDLPEKQQETPEIKTFETPQECPDCKEIQQTEELPENIENESDPNEDLQVSSLLRLKEVSADVEDELSQPIVAH